MTPTTSTPRIALLIPSYNSRSTVVETLKSVSQQAGLSDLLAAVYLADDCSLDDTIIAAQSGWECSVPLSILRGARNRGERGNVNDAIAAINGDADWILLLHSDDLVKPHWLQTMAARMARCPLQVATICSSWDNLHVDGSVTPGEDNLTRPIELIPGEPAAVCSTLLRGCWWHLSGCAIRVVAFEEIGGFRLNMPQLGDWEWLLRCLSRGWAAEYVPRTLLIYRQHASSVSSTSFQMDRDIREKFTVIKDYLPYLSWWEITKLHLQLHLSLIRRFGRGVLQMSLRRCLLASQTLWLTYRSWLSCCLQKRGSYPKQWGHRDLNHDDITEPSLDELKTGGGLDAHRAPPG